LKSIDLDADEDVVVDGTVCCLGPCS